MHKEFVVDTSNEDVDLISASFPEAKFTLFKAFVNNDAFLTGLSCWFENEEVLEKLWSRINNFVGAEYQSKLENEFSSWNIYLVFFISKKISNSLKYTVENDAFFMRKIIFDNQLVAPEKEHIAKYLNDHILGKNINVECFLATTVADKPQYSSITQSLLNAKLSLGNSPEDKQSRKAWLDNAILEVDENEN